MSSVELSQSRTRTRHERDLERGFRYDYKRVFMAYLIEGVVIAASLAGAWYFATKYGHQDSNTMMVMMLAPIGYAVIEFCRVPLAISVRAQRNWGVKIAALLGVVLAAGVTVKSMSQLGYLMFQPRLQDVTEARRTYESLASERDAFQMKRRAAEAAVDQRKDDLDRAGARAQEATKALGDRPKPTCVPTTYVDRATGRTMHGARCSTETVAPLLNERAVQAENDRKVALARYEAAVAERDALDPKSYDDKVTLAEGRKKDAIFNSQLHTFTAMVFGIDPDQVTEGQLHWFLRLFVFVPSICVAFASTLLAFTAVERLKRRDPVIVADEAGEFLLGPLAQAVVAEANRHVERVAREVLQDAAAEAARGAASAQGPAPEGPPGTMARSAEDDVFVNIDKDKVVPLKAAE